MKILIGCDELSSVENIHYDLKRAGLPDVAEVCVFSVADVFVLPAYKEEYERNGPSDNSYLARLDEEVQNARNYARALVTRLKSKFPKWQFSAESSAGSVAAELINKATAWRADLIVIGSHGRPGIGAFFFGSIAMKILTGAPCSVRIVRSPIRELDSPGRIVVAVDGSAQSEAAIYALTNRRWKEGSAVHLITAMDTVVNMAFISESLYVDPVIETITIPDDAVIKKTWRSKNKNLKTWIKRMHEEYEAKLKNHGLIVSSMIQEGDPKIVLCEEARRWGAESIFIGAVGHSTADRIWVGSVSAAVAARAHCSVEVTRL